MILKEACMNNEDEMEILTRCAKRAEKRKERGACP